MSDEEYEVEKILDKRVERGGAGIEYLVKWRNYEDPEENTWEPVDNLADAAKLIKVFEKDLEAKMNPLAANVKNPGKRKTGPGGGAQNNAKIQRVETVQQVSSICVHLFTWNALLLYEMHVHAHKPTRANLCSGKGEG